VNDNYPELAVKPTFLQDAETPSMVFVATGCWLIAKADGCSECSLEFSPASVDSRAIVLPRNHEPDNQVLNL